MGYDATSIPGGGSMFPILGGADLLKEPASLHKSIQPPSAPPTPLSEIPEVKGSSLAPSQDGLSNLEQNRSSTGALVDQHIAQGQAFEEAMSLAETWTMAISNKTPPEVYSKILQNYRLALDAHRKFPALGDKEAQLKRQTRLNALQEQLSGLSAVDMLAVEGHIGGKKQESAPEELSGLTRLAMTDAPDPQASNKETTAKASSPKTETRIASKKPVKPSTFTQVSRENKESIKREWEAIQAKVAKYRTLDPESTKAGKLKAEIKGDYTQLKLFDGVYKPGTVSLVLKSLGFHEKQVLASLDLHDRVSGTEVAGLSEELKQKVNQHKDKSI